MKRAISFFLLALFVLFIIQPNLDAKTQTAQIRTPEMTDSVLTNDDISRKTSKSQATIVIDPDKGGMDAGYDPVGHLAEKDVAMQLAINIGGALESAGYHVEYTRWYDNVETFNTRTESDQNRLDIAKSMNPQYLISIRFNTGDSLSKGFSVFTQPDNEQLDTLANEIATQIQATNFSVFEGLDTDHYANFTLLSDLALPSIMLQMGYLTNSEDYAKISDSQFQKRIGEAIAQAFLNTVD
ncbi:N-acetylmuramoyl-L-alanine amidase [Ileibacterium valens]|uniref:N-acetylmuramoyl-L-alanine amidase n=1 Tax=Ileibacterium valens TaxID=1862668 RepID=UPI002352F0DD|nr:N-acetylmuramoyl-L-alanine amidase [Ileibacterium valens]